MNVSTSLQVVALSTADHKQASLFFDRVVPLHSARTVPKELTFPIWNDTTISGVDSRITNAWRQLCDAELEDQTELPLRLKFALDAEGMTREAQFVADFIAFPRPSANVSRDEANEALTTLVDRFALSQRLQHLAANVRNRIAVVLSSADPQTARLVPVLGIFRDIQLPGGQDKCLAWTVSDLQLVDTQNTDWTEILNLRRDAVASDAFTKFRFLLADDFAGKSRQYVQDVISLRLDNYQGACKKHGLKTKSASIQVLLDPTSLIGRSALAAAALLTDDSFVLNAVPKSAAIYRTPRVGISLGLGTASLPHSNRQCELAYLVQAKVVRKL